MKLIKRIEEKANKLQTMFVTDNIYNDEQLENKKAKYFILFHNTYKIVACCETQRELEEEIDRILEAGQTDNLRTFY